MDNIEAPHIYPDLSDKYFLKTLVHESNNFLSAISGFSELSLMDIESDSPIQSHLKEIIIAVNRHADLNQQLLMLSGLHLPNIEHIEDVEVERYLNKTGFQMETESNQQYFLQANKKWLLKVFEALDIFAKSFKQKKNEVIILQHQRTVNFEFIFDPIGKVIEINNLFQPFYSTKNLALERGLGISWLPAFIKNIGGRLEANISADEYLKIILSFKRAQVG